MVIIPRLFEVWVKILLLPAFFHENLSAVRISALRWTGFYQKLKDSMREIQRFEILGHNLCKNDKQKKNHADEKVNVMHKSSI